MVGLQNKKMVENIACFTYGVCHFYKPQKSDSLNAVLFYFPVELTSKCICCVKGSVRTDRSKLQGNRGRALLDILAGCKNICNLQIYPASLWIYNKWVQIYQSVSTSIMHSALHCTLHRANISRLHVIFLSTGNNFSPHKIFHENVQIAHQ